MSLDRKIRGHLLTGCIQGSSHTLFGEHRKSRGGLRCGGGLCEQRLAREGGKDIAGRTKNLCQVMEASGNTRWVSVSGKDPTPSLTNYVTEPSRLSVLACFLLC